MTTDTVRTPEMDLKIRNAARKYPDWWIETILGGQLWRMQKAIAQAVFMYPRVTVRSCESAGKSYLAARIVLAFLYNHPPATVITTAPTNRQVEDVLWREIRGAFAQSKMALEGNLTRKQLDINENWFAVGFSTDEPERMLGYHNVNVLVIGDDAAGLSNDIYGAMENPLSTGNTHLLLISNPTQSVGAFRDTFNSELYKKYHISAFDTPNLKTFGITQEDIESGEWKTKWNGQEMPFPQLISPVKVAERFKEWGKGSYLYSVFILGDFPEAGIDNLCKLSDIESAMSRKLPEEAYDKNLKVAALDVARYGDDDSVFAVRQGNKVLETVTWGHRDSIYTAGRAARLIKEHRPVRTYVDVVGLGAGIYDILKKEIGGEFKVMEFDSGKPALDTERYLNRRAEGYWEFNQKLTDQVLELPNSDNLKAQLADIRYTYNARGLLQIESKEDAKSRGSKSPDIADAVMMTFGRKKGGSAPPVWRY
jgi:phage terminase large subunit